MSAVVGSYGGAVLLPDGQGILIPAGALDSEILVVVRKPPAEVVDTPVEPPAARAYAGSLAVEPHGLQLHKVAEIYVNSPVTLRDGSTLLAILWDEATKSWGLDPTSEAQAVGEHQAVVSVTHFSTHGSAATEGWASETGYGDADTAVRQGIVASALAAVGGSSGPSHMNASPGNTTYWLTDVAGGDGTRMRAAIGQYHVWYTGGQQGSTQTVRNNMIAEFAGSSYDTNTKVLLVDRIIDVYGDLASQGPVQPPAADQETLDWLEVRKQCLEWVATIGIEEGGRSIGYSTTDVADPSLYRPGMAAFFNAQHAAIITDIWWNADGEPTDVRLAEANWGTGWSNPVGSPPWDRTVRGDRELAMSSVDGVVAFDDDPAPNSCTAAYDCEAPQICVAGTCATDPDAECENPGEDTRTCLTEEGENLCEAGVEGLSICQAPGDWGECYVNESCCLADQPPVDCSDNPAVNCGANEEALEKCIDRRWVECTCYPVAASCMTENFDSQIFQADAGAYGTQGPVQGWLFYVNPAKTSENWIEQSWTGLPTVLTIYQKATGLMPWDMYLAAPAGFTGQATFQARVYNPQGTLTINIGVASCVGCNGTTINIAPTGDWAEISASLNITDGNAYVSLGSLPDWSGFGIKFDWVKVCPN